MIKLANTCYNLGLINIIKIFIHATRESRPPKVTELIHLSDGQDEISNGHGILLAHLTMEKNSPKGNLAI